MTAHGTLERGATLAGRPVFGSGVLLCALEELTAVI